MEDRSALGLVLNCIVLWAPSVWTARSASCGAGLPGLVEDVPRLSPFVRHQIGIDGQYSLQLPDLGGQHRPQRDPHTEDGE